MIGIVISEADTASRSIGERLLDAWDWERVRDGHYRRDGYELVQFVPLHVELEGVADEFPDPDLVVFAARHRGDTGPLLSAHFTGNFGQPHLGGDEGELAETCPAVQARVFDALRNHAPERYDVNIECTHHGPSHVGAPSLFVELGSSESEWTDPKGASAVAESILEIDETRAHAKRQLVGFGGGHYAPRFERVLRQTSWAVGHVGADWALQEMGRPVESRDVITQAFTKSKAEYAIVEGDHPTLERAIDECGFETVSETWVREVDDVPLEIVSDVSEQLCSVDEGLRFGEAAATTGDDYQVAELPLELLDEVQGFDEEATWTAVEEQTVAFETKQSASRLAGRIVVSDRSAIDEVVSRFVSVLEEKYDEVERTDGEVRCEESGFDPEKARELGVPEGPKFGRLANGEPVTVDGETVHPEDVTTDRRHLFELE